MSSPKLIVPNGFFSFYEHKKEMALTKEEEHFCHKVFQYALRMINGLTSSNRNSFNQKALTRTAQAWIIEYQEFKKRYSNSEKFIAPPSENKGDALKRVIVTSPKNTMDRADHMADAMTIVRHGSVYTTDNQQTMGRITVELYNEKQRGEHRYPRSRN